MRLLFYKVILKILRMLGLGNTLLKVSIPSGYLKGYNFFISPKTAHYLNGAYEIDTLNFVLENTKDDSVMYDLGANFGYFSLIMATHTKNNVYAFEAIPKYVDVIKSNIAINNVKNINVFSLAVSKGEGTIEFSNLEGESGNTYVQDTPNYESKRLKKIIVKTNSIDNMVESGLIKPPNLMKIDIEGAEYDALLGSEKTITKYKPFIILATHDYHLKGVKDNCLNFLKEKGYRILDGDKKTDDLIADFLAVPLI